MKNGILTSISMLGVLALSVPVLATEGLETDWKLRHLETDSRELHHGGRHHGGKDHGGRHRGDEHHGRKHHGGGHHGEGHHGRKHHGGGHHGEGHHGRKHHGDGHHGGRHHGNGHHGGSLRGSVGDTQPHHTSEKWSHMEDKADKPWKTHQHYTSQVGSHSHASASKSFSAPLVSEPVTTAASVVSLPSLPETKSGPTTGDGSSSMASSRSDFVVNGDKKATEAEVHEQPAAVDAPDLVSEHQAQDEEESDSASGESRNEVLKKETVDRVFGLFAREAESND